MQQAVISDLRESIANRITKKIADKLDITVKERNLTNDFIT
jgi:hypothetical protein